jgi:hypothetical protein
MRWEDHSNMDMKEVGCEDGTGSGSCPLAGFDIRTEPSSSATRGLARFLDRSLRQ